MSVYVCSKSRPKVRAEAYLFAIYIYGYKSRHFSKFVLRFVGTYVGLMLPRTGRIIKANEVT